MLIGSGLTLSHEVGLILCPHANTPHYIEALSGFLAATLGGFTRQNIKGGWVMTEATNGADVGDLVIEDNVLVSASYEDDPGGEWWYKFYGYCWAYWLGSAQDSIAIKYDGKLVLFTDRIAFMKELEVLYRAYG